MKRLLIALLLCLTVLNVSAQKTASDEVKRLQARMYKLYSGYDYDEFISVTDSLKRAAERRPSRDLRRPSTTCMNTCPMRVRPPV